MRKSNMTYYAENCGIYRMEYMLDGAVESVKGKDGT